MKSILPDIQGLKIGFDHPEIIPAPYCVICDRALTCLDERNRECINPSLAGVLLHRLDRGVLVKTFKPGVWRCRKCGEIVNQLR